MKLIAKFAFVALAAAFVLMGGVQVQASTGCTDAACGACMNACASAISSCVGHCNQYNSPSCENACEQTFSSCQASCAGL